MREQQYPKLGETVVTHQLDNGLTIYVNKKPGFTKAFAFFATNYGGMDMKFQLEGQWHTTPAGVAHFLEHKMFDTEEGNALQDLSANGANPNAFTSSALTGYYFVSTEHFEENLKTLLSFVSIPYFTQESVDKEQGIIGQEIRMIEDDPENQVFYGMLEGMYAHNPIRTSIAGTVESIAEITADTLYSCHHAFYNPGNMVLCVAGDIDPQTVIDAAVEILPAQGITDIPREYGDVEPATVVKNEMEQAMAVSTPIFQLGFKADVPPKGDELLRNQLLGNLAGEALLGSSSPLYAKLYAKGLINKGFGMGYETYPGAAFLTAGGESRDPKAVRDAILEEGERIAKEGIGEGLWQQLNKAAYGTGVRSLNSFEHICIERAQAHFGGYDSLGFPQAYEAITPADAQAFLATLITADRATLSVVNPKEDGK